MIHVWRQKGLPAGALNKDQEREQFVYWFYDTYHQSRAPYRLAAPSNTVRWLNAAAAECSGWFGAVRPATAYVTRYMQHVAEQTQREEHLAQFDSYLEFLCWFALEYIPSRNLPAELLPSDLLPLLNQSLRPALPMTAAMATWAELRGLAGKRDIHATSDEEVVARAFEMLPDFLEAGDPRLIPDGVSQFWSKKMSPERDALTAYEYFLARACRPDLAPDTARDWLSKGHYTTIPGADLFSAVPSSLPVPSGSGMNSPEKVIVVYRDHHTVAGL